MMRREGVERVDLIVAVLTAVATSVSLVVAILTPPEARDPELLKKLDAVAGRVLGR